MNKDRLIVRQVAFKGAVDLVVAGKLEIDEIISFSKKHTEEMMTEAPQEVTYKYGNNNTPEYQSPPKATANYGKPSEKQLGFIASLLKEVPKAEADKILPTVPKLSGKEASALIEKLISMKDSMTPEAKTPKDDSEAPF